MNRLFCIALVCSGVLTAPFSVTAQTNSPQDIQNAREEIWALEQIIYSQRGQGNLQPYVDRASNNYIGPHSRDGWVPGKETMQQIADRLTGNNKEKIDMNLKAFTLHSDTAVIYYLNNRTVRPDGQKVDEWYEVMHIWVRDQSDWALLASMPRLLVDYEPTEN